MGQGKMLQTLSIIGITINIVGLLTNGLSLSVLYGKEPVFKSQLLLYIRHQTIMDALSCVVGILKMIMFVFSTNSYSQSLLLCTQSNVSTSISSITVTGNSDRELDLCY